MNNILKKNFIKHNNSKYVVFVFIVKKKKLRVYVNYRVFNVFTLKNRNVSSFIKNTLTRFCYVKIYNKFDIIVVFNKIRIKENDEKKIAFFTRYDLFKYVIIFFDFCNVSNTFQVFINKTLKKYLNNFCIDYLNDIFVYNKNKKKYIKHVNQIFRKFKKTYFF